MPQECVCPRDQFGVVTQYIPSCPFPGHNPIPPATYPPPPSPCRCSYNSNGTLIPKPDCPLHGG